MSHDHTENSKNIFEADKQDTPDRSLAETRLEALRAEGGVFVEAVRSTRMPMVVTDPSLPENPIVFANEAFLHLSGYTMTEVLGQQPYFMNGAGTNEEDAAGFREALAEDRDTVIETVQYRKDGSRFVAAVLLSAFKDAAGNTVNQFLSYLDITRRVSAEAQLALSIDAEARLRASGERQTFLLTLVDTLRSLADPVEVQATAARLLGEHLRADRAAYYEVDAKGIVVPPQDSAAGSPPLDDRVPVADQGGKLPDSYAAGKTVVVTDMIGDPRISDAERHTWRALGVRSGIGVPLVKRWRLRALFALGTIEPRQWEIEEIALAEVVSQRVWDAVERARAELALREQEDRLRLVVEGARDYAIFTVDPAGCVVDWYAGAEKVFGFAAREILGRNISVLYTPEDREAGVPEQELSQAHARGSAPNIRWHVHKGGGRVFIEGYVVPLRDPGGSLLGFMKIGQDLTERHRADNRLQESERRFRTLAEGIPQLVWRASDHGKWSWASPQWTSFTGQANEQSQDWGWLETVHEEDRQAASAAWEQTKETGEFQADYRIREAATGTYRFFQTRATRVHDERGEIVEWLGTSTDVQDMRELQNRQAVLVAELQHRTRNLIAVVRSMADNTVRRASDLPEFREKFRDRLDALARVQGLLSRLDEHDRVTFDELIDTEFAALGTLDGNPERITLAGPAGIRLRSSSVQTLAMALHELVTNATKYGALRQPYGQLKVTWWLEPESDDGRRWLHIDWRENGVVMPAASARPEGTGQGRELIERALPYQLRAKTFYELGPDGVRCTISIPVSASSGTDENHHG